MSNLILLSTDWLLFAGCRLLVALFTVAVLTGTKLSVIPEAKKQQQKTACCLVSFNVFFNLFFSLSLTGFRFPPRPGGNANFQPYHIADHNVHMKMLKMHSSFEENNNSRPPPRCDNYSLELVTVPFKENVKKCIVDKRKLPQILIQSSAMLMGNNLADLS